MSELGTSASRLRLADVEPGRGCEVVERQQNEGGLAELCAVWSGDGVSGVGLLTDSHRSSGVYAVRVHAEVASA